MPRVKLTEMQFNSLVEWIQAEIDNQIQHTVQNEDSQFGASIMDVALRRSHECLENTRFQLTGE